MNVEIHVPAFSRIFEFELDEDMEIAVLIEEIAETICQYEHCTLDGSPAQMLLLHNGRKKALDVHQSLIQADVHNGDSLTLI